MTQDMKVTFLGWYEGKECRYEIRPTMVFKGEFSKFIDITITRKRKTVQRGHVVEVEERATPDDLDERELEDLVDSLQLLQEAIENEI